MSNCVDFYSNQTTHTQLLDQRLSIVDIAMRLDKENYLLLGTLVHTTKDPRVHKYQLKWKISTYTPTVPEARGTTLPDERDLGGSMIVGPLNPSIKDGQSVSVGAGELLLPPESSTQGSISREFSVTSEIIRSSGYYRLQTFFYITSLHTSPSN
ncbi:hypothetical protein BU17DRAFT_69556 [Hysterangium stoloniferum]|nr:hypothetical protein BU17DRAFT_69556 [Hysterangium stoloniferum]